MYSTAAQIKKLVEASLLGTGPMGPRDKVTKFSYTTPHLKGGTCSSGLSSATVTM